MPDKLLSQYQTLSNKIVWGPVEAEFVLGNDYSAEMISNVNIVPMVGDQYVLIKAKNGGYELPGGTLEPGESILDGLRREVVEEVGAELVDFHVLGHFQCTSKLEKPYRPHIPHPQFIRLIGYGSVKIIGDPTNPNDGEQIETVELVSIHEAIKKLEENDRYDLADLYRLAHDKRNTML
ncbi:ADP-ribose pyrophosphatase YjhB, NUDIX family [Paenibacillus sp. UNCCL117]|uniref:NUDIX hydrolase n=1 Tax=unclassified Paenibacillus TaxID=185978 RepID=UPI00088C4C59|nr:MULTISPECIES: NUDIX hydrolase [unclassified Paenibacillus]SDE43429.1 ADP-ribose pyrophosphatase YjhB, NUDIX family [Paenibacillus sp. cl123]SFW45989.1 ADP-ribose pyrophosphatase YjhB, NUDIX family [Paenibacillus sp. UNCCL117]